MNALPIATLALVIVGALNWGLVGVFGFDLVAAIFGEGSALARLVYVAVAAAGVSRSPASARSDSCAAGAGGDAGPGQRRRGVA
ncbi:MAG: DUF378 domain-containing protein [Paracoccaceae bacterium]